MALAKAATLEDLAKVKDKAELVDGRIIVMSPTGFLPGYAAGEIYNSLRAYARKTRKGYALGDGVGFVVNLPNRKSFSPDVSFHTGKPTGMKFLEGAPVFAAEVRSEGDYGAKAEKEIVKKRADYFAAGTLVVWDVDVLSQDVIRSYQAKRPEKPVIYRRGDKAKAEPAVMGWEMAVDELFPYFLDQEDEK
jgi:Uma2 family endonuclease